MKNEYDFYDGVRGSVLSTNGKTQITLFLDDDLLAMLREQAAQTGKGYQTLINDTLRNNLSPDTAPLTVATLRQILREVLPTGMSVK